MHALNIVKNISGCKMRFVIGICLCIMAIILFIIVAYIFFESFEDVGEEDEL